MSAVRVIYEIKKTGTPPNQQIKSRNNSWSFYLKIDLVFMHSNSLADALEYHNCSIAMHLHYLVGKVGSQYSIYFFLALERSLPPSLPPSRYQISFSSLNIIKMDHRVWLLQFYFFLKTNKQFEIFTLQKIWTQGVKVSTYHTQSQTGTWSSVSFTHILHSLRWWLSALPCRLLFPEPARQKW